MRPDRVIYVQFFMLNLKVILKKKSTGQKKVCWTYGATYRPNFNFDQNIKYKDPKNVKKRFIILFI